MPGPAPQKGAVRHNASRPDWITLPYAGRTGPPPKWPLERNPAAAGVRWRELWKLPQATQWEELHMERVVARYVLTLLVVEDNTRLDWTASIMGEARQLEDRLGLSPMALKRLQWEIAAKPSSEGSGPVAGVSRIDQYRDL